MNDSIEYRYVKNRAAGEGFFGGRGSVFTYDAGCEHAHAMGADRARTRGRDRDRRHALVARSARDVSHGLLTASHPIEPERPRPRAARPLVGSVAVRVGPPLPIARGGCRSNVRSMRRLVVGLVLIATATPACAGDFEDCGDATAPLTAVAESAAAERVTSCTRAVEFGGTTYIPYGCEAPVRRALLGPVVARNAEYVARSIDGVPTNTALAIRAIPDYTDGCRHWMFWADGDRDERAMNDLARRVNGGGRLS